MPDELPPLRFDSATHDYTIAPKRAPADVELDRHIRRLTFYLTGLLLLVLAAGAAYLAFLANDAAVSPASREWARGTLSAIVGGVVGYAFAKK